MLESTKGYDWGMSVREFDVAGVRAQFPALAEGLAHFDGPGGTQLPEPVIAAMTASMRSAVSNRGGPFASSARAVETVQAARAAVADLVGGVPAGVVLGANMTTLTYVLAGALAKTWRTGDEVVVSRLDHDANVRPWVQAAARAGAVVRWAEVEPDTCELPVDAVAAQLSERTRLVAVTGASNAVGTRPDVPAVAKLAHEVGARVYVDGVHLTPHTPVDVASLGADFYALSAYKFCGPHVGAVVADPAELEELRPDKLEPASDAVPYRFEHGTPSFALLAGVAAAVDYLAGLVPGTGDRRARVLASMAGVEDYEQQLFARLLAGIAAVDGLRLYGAAASRTPTLAFRLAGATPREVGSALGAQGFCVWDGNYYALELVRRLGLAETGGMVRVGLSPYNTAAEVDALVAAVDAVRSPGEVR